MELVYGAGKIHRRVLEVERLLATFGDEGRRYLDYRSSTPVDRLVPEDLAVTILINSRVGYKAFISVQDRAKSLDFARLPRKSLEATSESERLVLAQFLAEVTGWRGFGSSTATKVLHKKRPGLIPILDNQAIYGAYMYPAWPGRRSRQDTVKAQDRMKEALDWIAFDLNRPENRSVWPRLEKLEPGRTRIQLFDIVWWAYFREKEPVKPGRAL